MQIIVVGAGKVGELLVGYLSREGHDIVIIDRDSEVVQRMINRYDVNGFCGNGASNDILREAGAEKADVVVALTGTDEMNILCCLIANRLGTDRTIARVRNPEYQEQMAFMREELGISMLINPEYEAAEAIARIMRFPSAIKLDTFARGRVDIAEIELGEGSYLDGKALYMLPKMYKNRVLVCAVQRDGDVVIPSGDYVLHTGDHIHITASHEQMSAFLKDLGVYKQRIKKVLLVGGGRVGYYLSRALVESGMDVRIIEKDHERCALLSQMLPKVSVSHGDGTDETVLLEEGIDRVDAFAALTGIDEENVITSIYAGTRGVSKVVAQVNRKSFSSLIENMRLGSLISAKEVAASLILGYIRALNNTKGSTLRTMYKLVGGRVEAMEFVVEDDASFVSIPLKDLKMKSHILIAVIIRGRQIIYPHGEDMILPKDRVIVVAADRYIRNLQDILD